MRGLPEADRHSISRQHLEPAGTFRLTSEAPKVHIKTAKSENKRAHGFCSECGTSIHATSPDPDPLTSGLQVGSISQRTQFGPPSAKFGADRRCRGRYDYGGPASRAGVTRLNSLPDLSAELFGQRSAVCTPAPGVSTPPGVTTTGSGEPLSSVTTKAEGHARAIVNVFVNEPHRVQGLK